MKSMIVGCALVSGLSGCMTYDEGRVGPLGYSVYQTTYQQIADKQVAANPGTELPAAGADGPLLENVINGYRGATGDAQQVGQPIQIQVTDSTR
ncbi:hypothetical protein SE916_15175 [Pseudomonas sp. 5FOS]|uniref:hypothetical protein n=1 Tax=unclassified Pseudomonas TaxID=196821 RepID=UPI0007C639F2|nr:MULTISPECIES: hypothetical protein [unclassified Pseudomonas]MCE5985990.1 hypothetical protein [Pseudomonas sp. LM20]MCE5992770.1 hypothetical protein [Pseudomonas sp. KCA11]UMY60715.1 hypothetical protein MKK04_21270 [Pseudomonas sp. LS.1a]